LLLGDDPVQYRRVERLMLKLEEDGEEAIVTDNTLSEVVWVLETSYKVTKPEIVVALQAIVGVLGFQVVSPSRFYGALKAYIAGKGDFADYLLREQAVEAGCRAVATFDKALLTDAGFIEP